MINGTKSVVSSDKYTYELTGRGGDVISAFMIREEE
jgi:hypothetical protein